MDVEAGAEENEETGGEAASQTRGREGRPTILPKDSNEAIQ